ncbi:MAG TPA: AAA family ATPase [Anaerolineales bacterium]|nr:AAA family ATPase [Anaerolineales bacterium]
MNTMINQFTWIPIYQELADKLSGWENRQPELISFLEELRTQGFVITPLHDKDGDGARFLLKEIDPFTFFGVFNRRIGYDQRTLILSQMKQFFGLQSELPEDFNGVPVLNNMKSWFFPNQISRGISDIGRLWRVFQLALEENPLENDEFIKAFDEALAVKQTNVNLTMGLFWIRPQTFLNLDQTNRAYLGIRLPDAGLTAKFYIDAMTSVLADGKPFPELSLAAWGVENERTRRVAESKEAGYRAWGGINYWLAGAYWDDRDPADQTQRFVEEGIWENSYHNRYINEVMSMRVNDKIAIKSTSTQRQDLPFEARNKTISRMTIKAIGTIVANRNDGRTVEVEWESSFEEKIWYFYTNRNTIWHLRTDDNYRLKEYAQKLRDFVWYGRDQDHDWFRKRFLSLRETDHILSEYIETSKPPYSIEDLVASGVFLSEEELTHILERLQSKKAMILQGPPGVGKSFIARKLAYALMKETDNERLETVQFHQSYSYDDFVRGYRPVAGKAGSFNLQNGVFYEFCQKAIKDPDREYVFIIDEINRGNLSQIFGELLMLIEADKRGPEFALPLTYRNEDEPHFFVPPNLYLIGLMNLADRSLAMVDYALRRRFVFVTLKPQFESELFRQWLSARSMKPDLVELIMERLTELNAEIKADPFLGENYQIGHSFFLPRGDNFAGLNMEWYQGIVRTEIIPLLKEYWFDHPRKAEEAEKKLLA